MDNESSENPLGLPDNKPLDDADLDALEASGGSTHKNTGLPARLRFLKNLSDILALKKTPKPNTPSNN